MVRLEPGSLVVPQGIYDLLLCAALVLAAVGAARTVLRLIRGRHFLGWLALTLAAAALLVLLRAGLVTGREMWGGAPGGRRMHGFTETFHGFNALPVAGKGKI